MKFRPSFAVLFLTLEVSDNEIVFKIFKERKFNTKSHFFFFPTRHHHKPPSSKNKKKKNQKQNRY